MPLTAGFSVPMALVSFMAAASLSGSVVFTDSTFNPADYSITTFNPDPAVQIAVQQTQTGGNPGQALEILYTFPASSNGINFLGFMRASFPYDPATQGAIQSIDFSIDKYNAYTGCDSCLLSNNTARPLILQNGSFTWL